MYFIRKLLCCEFTECGFTERCRNCKKIVNNGTFIKYDKKYCFCIAGKYRPRGDKS